MRSLYIFLLCILCVTAGIFNGNKAAQEQREKERAEFAATLAGLTSSFFSTGIAVFLSGGAALVPIAIGATTYYLSSNAAKALADAMAEGRFCDEEGLTAVLKGGSMFTTSLGKGLLSPFVSAKNIIQTLTKAPTPVPPTVMDQIKARFRISTRKSTAKDKDKKPSKK